MGKIATFIDMDDKVVLETRRCQLALSIDVSGSARNDRHTANVESAMFIESHLPI